MDFQDMAAAIKSAADSLRKMPAVRKGNNVSYTIVVKVGYEEIKKLREDGYSYDTICKMFSEKGLLGANANPKSFCTAFLRETKRRLARTSGLSPTIGTGNASAKKTEADFPAVRTPGTTPPQRTEAVAPVERSETEQERIKRLISSKVSIGIGGTVKNPDGSFDIL